MAPNDPHPSRLRSRVCRPPRQGAPLRSPERQANALARPPEAALADATPREIGAARTKPGTVNATIVRFYQSARYQSLAEITKSTYRNQIERFRADHGDKRIATLRLEDVQRMVDARASTPAAANNFLEMLRMLMKVAIKEGWRNDDPTALVEKVRHKSDGYHSWTDTEIAQFEARHPVGTKARLALDLLLYTAQRRSDVVKAGRQHVSGGMIRFRQKKTGTVLEIPVLPALAASLAAAAGDHLTFLTTEYGKPFSPAGFGNWFRERCNEAGLPHCSAHGLRKAAARRLAEAGCSATEIMSITGHRTLAEAEKYVRAADQRKGARAAFTKLSEAKK
jgi:integrase